MNSKNANGSSTTAKKKPIPKSKLKITVTERQFLEAQKKAYKLWKEIVEKDDLPLYHEGYYVACAQNPTVRYYTVCHQQNSINTATGMFRFCRQESSDKFIKLMGDDIKYLFPSIETKK